MYTLKKLPAEGVRTALRKAERYRLLGEPCEAESICADVLEVEPGHHDALVLMILSLTDQFRGDLGRHWEAKGLVEGLEAEYERAYYSGLVAERFGKAQLVRGGPSDESNGDMALREAMAFYERAESLAPADTPDAVLRWNTCARTLGRRGHPASKLEEKREVPQLLE